MISSSGCDPGFLSVSTTSPLFSQIVIRTIRCSIFSVRENKIIPATISPGMPEQKMKALSEKERFIVFFGPGDV
jgi:hypothetical protein